MLRQSSNGASSALQKASALLKGGRNTSTSLQFKSRLAADEDGDISSYLSGLAKKTTGRDAGSTADAVPPASSPGSKFLKKKPVNNTPEGDEGLLTKPLSTPQARGIPLPAKAQSESGHGTSGSAQGSQKGHSNANEGGKSGGGASSKTVHPVPASGRGSPVLSVTRSVTQASQKTVHGRAHDTNSNMATVHNENDGSSSLPIGSGQGQRFLKSHANSHHGSLTSTPVKAVVGMPLRRSAEGTSTADSGDEGMTAFMEGLATSDSMRTSEEFEKDHVRSSPPKAVAFADKPSRHKPSVRLPPPVIEVMSSSSSSEPSSRLAPLTSTARDSVATESAQGQDGNVFDMDALTLAESSIGLELRNAGAGRSPFAATDLRSSATAVLTTAASSTAHEILDSDSLATENVASEVQSDVSIRTESPSEVLTITGDHSQIKKKTNGDRAATLRSPSPSIGEANANSSQCKDAYSEDFEVSSQSASSETADDASHLTCNRVESESDDRSLPSLRRHRHSTSSHSDSYDSATWHSATPTPRRSQHSARRSPSSDSTRRTADGRHRPVTSISRPATTSVGLQTGLDLEEAILRHHWNSTSLVGTYMPLYGVDLTDPTVILSDAVIKGLTTSLTSSPAALADLLRQQVDLTRDFVETQKRLHRSLLESLDDAGATYRYTTLEETKQYIRAHKKKTLTFDEALEQVKQDMNIA